jgi:hypothetical protein
MFGTTLTDEYRRVAAAFGLDVAAVAGLVVNAVDASFLAAGRKADLRAGVAAAAASAADGGHDFPPGGGDEEPTVGGRHGGAPFLR